ncbi:HAD family hydrolase [Spirosoma sp.]|uniref:D-glycero-alpha-D-manno-heptose-1,7-bisphosphate 7-phosphatase n=1 Tax=Spirosoma sp. TaxID=1899569 RepID=UPI00261FCF4D|nr:HAD family hydrolase [Spirosoma sp.]MCX6215323.1 HAD family hydrolase [Spirosoma sp.]
MNKAIFWDKDGTLIPDIPYNVDPAKITLYTDAGSSLCRLRAAGFKLIIISNQSGVAHGYFKESKLSSVWNQLTELLSPYGAEPDGFYYCPHFPGASIKQYDWVCTCRKPRPGLLLKAAREHQIDLSQSWMVGDILNDVEAGNRAGCRTVLIDRGNETEWLINSHRLPTTRAKSLSEATDYILATTRQLVRPDGSDAYPI